MNALVQGLIVSDLAAATANARLGQSHLLGARTMAGLHGLDQTAINLANYHFSEAARLLDQATGAAPDDARSLPSSEPAHVVPPLGGPAPSENLRESAQSADEPSPQPEL